MRCYFHHQCNCFIDYVNDPFLDYAVIYAEDISFQYNEQEGTFTEFLGNPTGTMNFLLGHRGTALHASHFSAESRTSNHSYAKK